MWFRELTGFEEAGGDQVRANIRVDGPRMTSLANGRQMVCGTLEIASLAELREQVRGAEPPRGRLRVEELVGDVQQLHRRVEHANAVFQVASQFNLLEMVSPSVTPDEGVDRYEFDRTQGPACAIACGAGTIYRNYFVPVNGETGQSADHQIDCLADLGRVLGNTDERLWTMRNGYALGSARGLAEISRRLSDMSDEQRDGLRAALRVGVQWDTQVTLGDASHTVTQVYCSALPVAYSNQSIDQWEEFARLVLEASYEATFCAAIVNAARTGSTRLFLTLLGAGAFGNDDQWILAAIDRAIGMHRESGLDVAIVSYSGSKPLVRDLVQRWESES